MRSDMVSGRMVRAGASRNVNRRTTLREQAHSGWLTAERFVGLTLGICLFLQRLALPYGSLAVSLATPLVLLLSGWGLMVGILTVDRRRVAFFLGLVACGLVATAVHASYPLAIAPRTSLNSLIYWLAMTAFAVLRLSTPMDERRFFSLLGILLELVAIAGIAEFVAQLVGLRLFSFSGLVPANLLIEREYDVLAPIPGTGLLRSNGFFLVEPSVFSQFMALGVIVEWLLFRRPARLVLYLVGLLVSVSGTGWLVLCVFVVELAFVTGALGALRAMILIAACILMVALASLVMPDITGVLTERSGELTVQGSSAYQRFVTPFMVLTQVLNAAPWSILTGIGPGASEQLLVAFFYQLNTPVKVMLEYGVPGLVFYLLLLLDAARTSTQWLLIAPLFMLLMFTGGYQQFSPILFPVLLIGTVALLQPNLSAHVPRANERLR
jgi:hypothetical protein